MRDSAFQALQKGFALTDLTRLGGNVSKHIRITKLLALRTKALAAMGLALCAAISDPLEPQGQFACVIIWPSFCGTADLLTVI